MSFARSRGCATLVGIAFLLAGAVASAAPLKSTDALVRRLTRAGRADVRVLQTVTAAGDTVRKLRGRLALEPPDRLWLEDTAGGERLTVRGDGGEWLQPAARQMLVLRPEQALRAASVWRLLLSAEGDAFQERSLGGGGYVLTPRQGSQAPAETVWVRVAADGLPARIEARAGEERWDLRFSGWKFGRARGPQGFMLRAPAGYVVVEWP